MDPREAVASVNAKAEGAFLGLAVGDALGWPQERRGRSKSPIDAGAAHLGFVPWTRRVGYIQSYEEGIGPGEYSDDTQLTLAVARSRSQYLSDWWRAFTRMELPLWTLYWRGAGGASRRAARAWCSGRRPWEATGQRLKRYFEAGGNGVAMRVLPHAVYLSADKDDGRLIHDVVLDGVATHGHPRALVGAAAYAYAAWVLARKTDTMRYGELLDALLDDRKKWARLPEQKGTGDSWFSAGNTVMSGEYPEMWAQTAREMQELLERARDGVREGALANDAAVLRDMGCFSAERGSGTRSAAAAVYLATRHAAQPVRAVLTAAFAKGADTDTLAGMTGGLCGCLSGADWIPPSWLEVQDAAYIRGVARRIARGDANAVDNKASALGNREIRELRGEIMAVDGEAEISFGSMGRARVKGPIDLRSTFHNLLARRWRITVLDGQTLYVSKAEWPSRASHGVQPKKAQQVYSRSEDPHKSMYAAFCTCLTRALRSSGPLKPREVADVMDLVETQARKWLAQAEKDGIIRQTSKKPVRYGLSERLLL